MWIDQGTGSIIDQTDKQIRKLDDGTPVLDLELSFTDETVAENVKTAKANNSQLSLVGRCPPRARAPGPAGRGRRCVPRLRRPVDDDGVRRHRRPDEQPANIGL